MYDILYGLIIFKKGNKQYQKLDKNCEKRKKRIIENAKSVLIRKSNF
jgi:hypothetical protein